MRNRCVQHSFLQRKLTYWVDLEQRSVASMALPELPTPMIILGEAGMGKTRLMQWLGEQRGYAFATAKQLSNRNDPRSLLGSNRILVIDAIDEVAARNDGDAVDIVLRKLGELGYPPFALSCRATDWRSATSREAITEQYESAPLELHIEPLDSDQARIFLGGNETIGETRAETIVNHFVARGLGGWLGNPQTLTMLERVLEDSEPPETSAELFAQYVDVSWSEHSHRKTDTGLHSAGKEVVLDALGAMFAALILGGKSALSRKARHNVGVGDIPVGELARLPGAARISDYLSSRLVEPLEGETDRFTYQHRRIGEYLGARWLAGQADTQRKQNRLIALLRSTGGIVPANLRGLHAWLGWHRAELASDVIMADPMGVIEYGDADGLTEDQARALFEALETLAELNPRFRGWREYRARSLMRPSLLPDAKRVLSDRAKPFALRKTIVEQISEPRLVALLEPDLRALLFREDVEFAIRHAAGAALIQYANLIDWPILIENLRCRATLDDMRLAFELLEMVGFDKFHDDQIVESLLAYAGLTLCPLSGEDENSIAGRFIGVRKVLPGERCEGLLDVLAEFCEALLPDNAGYQQFELIDLAYELILRRLEVGRVEPVRLWLWLKPFEDQHGYRRDNRDRLIEWFKNHEAERRAIQRHVLLDKIGQRTLWELAWRLSDRVPGLMPTPEDVIALLAALDPTDHQDDRWKDAVLLARHNGDEGRAVRDAAKVFAVNSEDARRWLEELAHPREPEWQVRQAQRLRDQQTEREARWAMHRADYTKHRTRMRSGDFGAILSPAEVYTGRAHEADRELPPHERIAEWLGADLQDDAFAGFEAFLQHQPPKPTAEEMAESFGNSRRWHAGAVIVAAFAERLRSGQGFDDLPDERVIAARLELEHGGLRQEEFRELERVVDLALRRRDGVYERYVRLLVEPGLRRRRTIIMGLSELMRTPRDAELAAALASEWLNAYPRMAAETEEELIDRLVGSSHFETLRALALRRLRSKSLGERRRRNWQALRLLTDFGRSKGKFAGIGIRDPNLLWTMRSRYGGGRDQSVNVAMPLELTAWIVREFRKAFPYRSHPTGVSSGNTNPWDASEYLAHLIGRIGDEASDSAVALLAAMRAEATDGYSEYLKIVIAEQAAKRADQDHRSPTLRDIAAVVSDGPPQSVEDLRTVVLEELNRVEALVRSDNVDSWRGFYTDWVNLVPKHEEECSDYLINLLRQNQLGVVFNPEPHLGSDKEGDIECTYGQLWLPVEAKGQWHAQLWREADRQLDGQQASDHRANRCGIYLVYWFGAAGKALQGPPRGFLKPATPAELEAALTQHSRSAREGRVIVKVLDLERRSDWDKQTPIT